MDSLYNPLRSGSVVSGRLGDSSVLSGSIGSGQVSSGHLASGLLAALTSGASIASGQVTSGLIGNGAVHSGSIASGSIGSVHIASGSIGWASLASGAVVSGHIGSGAITSSSIASGSIGLYHLAPMTAADIPAIAEEPISGGSLVFVSSYGKVSRADSLASGRAKVVGSTLFPVVSGAPAIVRPKGASQVILLSGLTLAAGDSIFLATDGMGTNIPPVAPSRHVEAGVILDASGYNPGLTVLAAMAVREPIDIP